MIRKFNLATPEMLPRLLTNNETEPGKARYPLRSALVRHNVETTYVIPSDWPHKDGDAWFLDGASAGSSDAQYLVDGPETFQAMVEAMQTADKPGHFIVLLGWQLEHNFKMADGKTFIEVAEERAHLGVRVRVLLWDNMVHRHVTVPAKALNDLRTNKNLDVYCQIDDNTKLPIRREISSAIGHGNVSSLGSHHHKILLVSGREGLVGFCGGIDPDSNRISYLHDVQVRVVGDAAKQLLKIAEERWAHAKDNGVPAAPATISIPPVTTSPFKAQTPYLTRVVETVGNPEIAAATPNTLWPSIKHAIERASRFIYIEDQYFWSMDLVDVLVQASKRVKHITILLPAAMVTEPNTWGLRQAAIRALVEKGGPGIEKRIGIFQYNYAAHRFIHAKVFAIDDEYAIVSSANANKRGYFTDSEAAVCVAERGWEAAEGNRGGAWFELEANFARRLRMDLWEEHLGLSKEELFDGVGSRAHWDAQIDGSRVGPYEAIDLRTLWKPWVEFRRDRLIRGQANAYLGPWGDLVLAGLGVWPAPKADLPSSASPSQRKRWWEAPYAQWDPGFVIEDLVVDP